MSKQAAGRQYQDFQFNVKSAKGKRLEQLISVENPEKENGGPVLIYIKMEGISWSQYFLDVCFGVWENWGEIDLSDETYVYSDIGKQYGLEGKTIQAAVCENSEISLQFTTDEQLILKYKITDDWDGDTELVFHAK